jgi:hypothetical protein
MAAMKTNLSFKRQSQLDLSPDSESIDRLDEESLDDKDTETGSVSEDQAASGKEAERDEIAAKESINISRWRGMVIMMLLLTAASVITSTYIFLSREEQDEFEKSVSRMVFRNLKRASICEV